MKRNLSCSTKRLALVGIAESDTDFIVRLRSSKTVYQYFIFPHPISEEDHLKWYYDSYLNNPNRHDFVAIQNSNGNKVGVFGMKRDSLNSKTVEISYILAPEEQGKGYAKEAVCGLIELAKTEWNCQKVIAEIHNENNVSIHFVKKLGFHFAKKQNNFLIYEKQIF